MALPEPSRSDFARIDFGRIHHEGSKDSTSRTPLSSSWVKALP